MRRCLPVVKEDSKSENEFLVYYVRGLHKRPIDRHLPRLRGGVDIAAGGDGLRQVAAARRGRRPSVSPGDPGLRRRRDELRPEVRHERTAA